MATPKREPSAAGPNARFEQSLGQHDTEMPICQRSLHKTQRDWAHIAAKGAKSTTLRSDRSLTQTAALPPEVATPHTVGRIHCTGPPFACCHCVADASMLPTTSRHTHKDLCVLFEEWARGRGRWRRGERAVVFKPAQPVQLMIDGDRGCGVECVSFGPTATRPGCGSHSHC